MPHEIHVFVVISYMYDPCIPVNGPFLSLLVHVHSFSLMPFYPLKM